MERPFETSSSGVRVAVDFRDNLIIDRYDPLFARMRAKKLKHLRSENSEDAVTWNVFRSLRQIDPAVWLPTLQHEAGIAAPTLPAETVCVDLWRDVSPPLALLAGGDEGVSEIDVVLEAPTWVWFIEAKFRSDISVGTTTRPERDQVLRNLDVGSYYAGVRSFLFSLLIRDEETSPKGVEAVKRYQDLAYTRSCLSQHRPDQLANVKSVGFLTWASLGRVLAGAERAAVHSDEAAIAAQALGWLRTRGLAD